MSATPSGRYPASIRLLRRRRLRVEEIEPRLCLSSVVFAPHDIAFSETHLANTVFAADVDNDGDMDILAASEGDNNLAWYENFDGKGRFGEQNVISTSADGAQSIFAADVDGDGDVDVLSASSYDDKVAWYENTDGNGSFGEQNVISSEVDGAISVFAADLDGDGDIDVLYASRDRHGTISWRENVDGKGRFGEENVIGLDVRSASSVYATDVDGDGDADVLSGSITNTAWYENIDGSGNFGEQQVITRVPGTTSIVARDLDGDDDADVLLSSNRGDRITWFENTDGNGTFEEHIITRRHGNHRSVFAIDLDGDRDFDVISSDIGHNKIVWYENVDGQGTFGNENVISLAANGPRIHAADIDGDGDADVISASSGDGKIAWYENSSGKGDFGEQQVISKIANHHSIHTADVDGDGGLDIVTTSYADNTTAWYRNTDTKGEFSERIIISKNTKGYSVHVADIDGDGDKDVLTVFRPFDDTHPPANNSDFEIAWFENTDGRGQFAEPRVVSSATDGNDRSVSAADVDGDGDLDILTSNFGRRIAWYENVDGKGTFGRERTITALEDILFANETMAVDLDSDGDLDVLAVNSNLYNVSWYENDGSGSFGAQRIIVENPEEGFSIFAADLDGDRDMDVLVFFKVDRRIAWYENNGSGEFGSEQLITTQSDFVPSIYAADLDGDGDIDVLSASHFDGEITWYENRDGEGTFGPGKYLSTSSSFAFYVYAADVDGDGDMDVISGSTGDRKIVWYEQLSNVVAGDANHNFIFDQLDIVQVLQAAKYQTGESATFAEGDWNGDGVFDQLDVVAALQTGNYLRGPYVDLTIIGDDG